MGQWRNSVPIGIFQAHLLTFQVLLKKPSTSSFSSAEFCKFNWSKKEFLAPNPLISLPHPLRFLVFLTWLIGWHDLGHPPLWELGKDSVLEALGYQGAQIPLKALA